MYQTIRTGNSTIVILDGYAIRFYKDGSSAERVERICRILDYLHSNGGKVQEVIREKGAGFVNKECGCWVTKHYIGDFHDGREKQIKNFAHELARIHLLLKDCKIPFNYFLNRREYKSPTLEEWETIYNTIPYPPNIQDKIVLETKDMLREGYDLLERCNADASTQLIHFDLHPKNVLFQDDDVAVILDFNAMRRLNILQDVAFAAFRFAYYLNKDYSFVREYSSKFVTYYNEINQIDMGKFDYYLLKRLLYLTSYILKCRYLEEKPLEDVDLKKYTNFVKVAMKGIL